MRAEGVEPSRAFAGSTDFHATSAFAAAIGVRGLDYPFDVLRIARSLAAARLVSTPSRRKPSVRAWLGIAIAGFPDFGQFCIAGFPASTQVLLKSVASASSATPAWPIIRCGS